MAFTRRSEAISYGRLRVESQQERTLEALQDLYKSMSSVPGIFLSHSHHDREIVYGVKRIIQQSGAEAYVDLEDGAMPTETGRATAERIKNKIASNDRFIVLLTDNSRSSIWVPWELGIADEKKGLSCVAVWPIADESGDYYDGQEYLQLYANIQKADDGKYAVFQPRTSRGAYLTDWVKDKVAV